VASSFYILQLFQLSASKLEYSEMFHRRGIEGLLPFLYINMTGTLDGVK